jgi:recA bacterial DNA recombination protein
MIPRIREKAKHMTSAPHKLHAVQTLLRARKLDRTLTSEGAAPGDAVAPFAMETVNHGLRGGLPRGQLSELHGPVSSGRTSLGWAALAAATARREWVALIDTFDRFDPEPAAAAGVELSRLLWVRGQALSRTSGVLDPAWIPGERSVQGPGTLLERTLDRAIKAFNLVAQSGVCTMVVLDLIDAPPQALTRIPRSTWLRLQRVVEGTEVALLLLAATPIARSAGGLSIATGAGSALTSGVEGTIASGATASAVPDSRLPAAGCRLPVADSRLPVADSRLPVTDCRLPVAGSHTRIRWKGSHDRTRRLGGFSTGVRATSPRGYVGELPLAIG